MPIVLLTARIADAMHDGNVALVSRLYDYTADTVSEEEHPERAGLLADMDGFLRSRGF